MTGTSTSMHHPSLMIGIDDIYLCVEGGLSPKSQVLQNLSVGFTGLHIKSKDCDKHRSRLPFEESPTQPSPRWTLSSTDSSEKRRYGVPSIY
jgi:hypothetical protein